MMAAGAAVGAATFALAAPASAAVDQGDCGQVAGNIVVNCGFETGDFTGWQAAGYYSAANDSEPHSGTDAAYLLANRDHPGTLSQALTGALPATTYTVHFFVARVDFSGFPPTAVSASVSNVQTGASTGTQLLYSDTIDPEDDEYREVTASFTTPALITSAPTFTFSATTARIGAVVVDDVSVASPKTATLSKITGGIGIGYTTKVTDAKSGKPVTTGTVSYYGAPGFLCTAQVVKGTATCSIPTALRGRDLVTQLTRGFGVSGEFGAPGYISATTTNGLPGAPTLD